MISTFERPSPSLSAKRMHGRVINVIAEMLRSRLSVPEIYLEPKISSALRPDILAVDKAGSGDLHGVEIKVLAVFPTRTQLRVLTESLRTLPYHYKYLAMPSFSRNHIDAQKIGDLGALFDERGIGRVGIISFDPEILGNSALSLNKDSAHLTVTPERFRVPAEKLVAIEKFLTRAKPDISVRI